MGKDIVFLSLTIDAKNDRPEQLARYREGFGHDFKGWYHLTGDYDEIEALRRTLGVYDLDPIIDADKTEHAGIITFGNDKTDWWGALPALMNAEEITETVARLTAEQRRSPFRQKVAKGTAPNKP